MKRIICLLLTLLMLAAMATSVSAATTDIAAAGDNTVYINLYLDPADKYPVVSAECVKGEIPTHPAEPGREGMTFIDWYGNRALTYRFDFTKPLYEDADVYARFVPTEDAIGVNVFNSPQDDYPAYGYLLAKGDYAEYPADPEYDWETMEFLGWYSDRAMTKSFDFSQPVYDYLSLYPRIVPTEDTYTAWLYWDSTSTEPITGFTFVKGEPVSRPADPGQDDYKFIGWYSDRALTKPVDFTKPQYEDIDLIGKWEWVCDHYGVFDHYVPAKPATATTDGSAAHYECPKCGKWFYDTLTALIEVEDHDDLIIDATGPYLLGDTDGNGEVDIIDATLIQRKMADMTLSGGFCRKAADVDSDDDLSVIDATLIRRCIAMMPVPYPIDTYVN